MTNMHAKNITSVICRPRTLIDYMCGIYLFVAAFSAGAFANSQPVELSSIGSIEVYKSLPDFTPTISHWAADKSGELYVRDARSATLSKYDSGGHRVLASGHAILGRSSASVFLDDKAVWVASAFETARFDKSTGALTFIMNNQSKTLPEATFCGFNYFNGKTYIAGMLGIYEFDTDGKLINQDIVSQFLPPDERFDCITRISFGHLPDSLVFVGKGKGVYLFDKSSGQTSVRKFEASKVESIKNALAVYFDGSEYLVVDRTGIYHFNTDLKLVKSELVNVSYAKYLSSGIIVYTNENMFWINGLKRVKAPLQITDSTYGFRSALISETAILVQLPEGGFAKVEFAPSPVKLLPFVPLNGESAQPIGLSKHGGDIMVAHSRGYSKISTESATVSLVKHSTPSAPITAVLSSKRTGAVWYTDNDTLYREFNGSVKSISLKKYCTSLWRTPRSIIETPTGVEISIYEVGVVAVSDSLQLSTVKVNEGGPLFDDENKPIPNYIEFAFSDDHRAIWFTDYGFVTSQSYVDGKILRTHSVPDKETYLRIIGKSVTTDFVTFSLTGAQSALFDLKQPHAGYVAPSPGRVVCQLNKQDYRIEIYDDGTIVKRGQFPLLPDDSGSVALKPITAKDTPILGLLKVHANIKSSFCQEVEPDEFAVSAEDFVVYIFAKKLNGTQLIENRPTISLVEVDGHAIPASSLPIEIKKDSPLIRLSLTPKSIVSDSVSIDSAVLIDQNGARINATDIDGLAIRFDTVKTGLFSIELKDIAGNLYVVPNLLNVKGVYVFERTSIYLNILYVSILLVLAYVFLLYRARHKNQLLQIANAIGHDAREPLNVAARELRSMGFDRIAHDITEARSWLDLLVDTIQGRTPTVNSDETITVGEFNLRVQQRWESYRTRTAYNLDIRFNLAPADVSHLLIPANVIGRVMSNCLSNVFRYVQPNTIVEISTAVIGDKFIFAIENVIDSSRVRQTRGHQIGQKSDKALVQSVHGSYRVQVKNNVYRVEVLLPFTSNVSSSFTANTPYILVGDNHELTANSIQKSLSDIGIEVKTVLTLKQLELNVLARTPAVVITDLTYADRHDALATIRMLREAHKNLPIILMSEYRRPPDTVAEQCQNLGLVWLPKDDILDLQEKVMELLKAPTNTEKVTQNAL